MTNKKTQIVTFNELFPDYQALVEKWNVDFLEMKSKIENAIQDLTHLTVEIKVEEGLGSRKTEIDLVSGDVTITLPKIPSEEDLAKIQAEALKMAQENLDKRIDLMVRIIKVVCEAISPTGPLNSFVKNLADSIKPS
jgi:hypothetical protein